MADELYYLSPYCVFYAHRDNQTVTATHALYGSKFKLAADFFKIVVGFLNGSMIGEFTRDWKKELDTLIAEKILIDQEEFNRLNRSDVFRNRLQPIELAFQRGFNEGGLFPDLLDFQSTPALAKEVQGLESVPLKMQALAEQKGLIECLLERRSIRTYSDRPLALRELEKFFQLAAKAYALVEIPHLGKVSMRNYPSGGARYPLEIYPIVYNVELLKPGIYHYHPFQHCLTLLNPQEVYRELVLDVIRQKTGSVENSGVPAVIFVITSVLARTCWKYTGVPHHLILQEVGALYQTMYLAATLLGLAPCCIGAFPELAIDEMLSLDSQDETQVGLFVLGTPAEAREGAEVALVVEGLEVLDGSPFSADKDRRCVELRFRGGQKEIMALEDFRLERSSDNKWQCYAMRGRHKAEFDEPAQAILTKLLERGTLPYRAV